MVRFFGGVKMKSYTALGIFMLWIMVVMSALMLICMSVIQ